jgi:hypothetical protein
MLLTVAHSRSNLPPYLSWSKSCKDCFRPRTTGSPLSRAGPDRRECSKIGLTAHQDAPRRQHKIQFRSQRLTGIIPNESRRLPRQNQSKPGLEAKLIPPPLYDARYYCGPRKLETRLRSFPAALPGTAAPSYSYVGRALPSGAELAAKTGSIGTAASSSA